MMFYYNSKLLLIKTFIYFKYGKNKLNYIIIKIKKLVNNISFYKLNKRLINIKKLV